ncbi:acyl carrier protein [Streptomyces sp. 2231.1]|uniref:acyl carrier protein n=1 Tax=Streptomyces sp. 2231.1 TaxID=1855347 RepID=UPI00089CA6C6|nr:acyl carrier protein [Streptomyces sp. 2231.1]SEE67580.1 acyl carrier protein [Streptomyces sp. 2231.1]
MSKSYDSLVSLLVEQFEVREGVASPEKTLGELGVDSLAVVELAVAMDVRWGIKAEDSGIDQKTTLRDAAALVAERTAAQPVEGS